MPYEFSRGEPDFSVLRGASFGFLAGSVVSLLSMNGFQGFGFLGLVAFGAALAALYRNVKILLASAAVMTPLLASWGFPLLFGDAAGPVIFLVLYLAVFVFVMTVPGDGYRRRVLFYSTLVGLFSSAVLGSVLVTTPLLQHLESAREIAENPELATEAIELILVGFPAFGACYGAGLVLMHEDEQEED